jgi:hypothetical protein
LPSSSTCNARGHVKTQGGRAGSPALFQACGAMFP